MAYFADDFYIFVVPEHHFEPSEVECVALRAKVPALRLGAMHNDEIGVHVDCPASDYLKARHEPRLNLRPCKG